MDVVFDNLDVFARGLRTTVSLTLLSFAVALVIGTVVAACRVSPVPPLRWVGALYVETVRNTPLTVLFFLFFYGLTKVGIQYDNYTTAIIVLGGYTGTFVGEMLRSGINAVSRGQAEAARSLGLTFPQVLGIVVLPQALRTVVAPLGGLFIALTKNSSIASIIAVGDLVYEINFLSNETARADPDLHRRLRRVSHAHDPFGRRHRLDRPSGGDPPVSAPTVLFLADELGPRGRRRVRIATGVAAIVLLALAVVAYGRLSDRGQLDWDRWEPLTRWSVLKFLLGGMGNTLRVAVIAMVLALILGSALALLRLARTGPLRWFAAAFIEFFRGIPLLLLIFFTYFGLRSYDIDISPYRALVLALAIYNGAVLGEIFRAGIRSLDRGQTEASYAIGLGYWQTMLLVVIPQAVRRMVPAIVSQLVTLLKDSSLGFIVTYEEGLRRSRSTGTFFNNPLQATVVIALMFIAVNYSLSRLARWLEVRQRRRFGAGAIVVGGAEDLNTVGLVAASATEDLDTTVN